MKYLWENKWFFVPVLIAFVIGGVLAFWVPYGEEIIFFNHLRIDPLNTIFRFITLGGEFWAYLLFGGVLIWIKPRFGLIVAIMGFLSLPIMYLLKDSIGVDRPIAYFEQRATLHEVVLVPEADMNRGKTSFPSGHSMAGFALFGLLSLMLPRKYQKWGLMWAFLAILVGVSRIFLVQHFLVDVIAGAWLGLMLCSFIWLAAERWLPKRGGD
ncbi:MAG: phosphatase PAP2 family protein [Saprospiraceae bacterium]|nr:phosphatase PAP2 family protein [Saprospiraceae bacterium]